MVTMYRSTGLMLGLITITMLAGPVLAAPDDQGRYTMTATEKGMLRLDTRTGAVSICTGKAGRWVCRSIADDRLALENEIDRLSNENQQLKDELAQREMEAPSQMQPQMQPQPDAPESWMLSDRHVEEFMTFFEKMMTRFKKIAESMQDDAPTQ